MTQDLGFESTTMSFSFLSQFDKVVLGLILLEEQGLIKKKKTDPVIRTLQLPSYFHHEHRSDQKFSLL